MEVSASRGETSNGDSGNEESVGEASEISDEISAPQEPVQKPQSRLLFKANCGCGICYETVEAAEDAIPMFCCSRHHIVHIHCLVKWCVQKKMEHQTAGCPFCRQPLLTPSQFDDIYEWQHYDDTEENNSSSHSRLRRATRRILSYFPMHTQMTEMRLVRLTLFSYLTMLLNVILLCIIFVFLARTYSTYSYYSRNAVKYQAAKPKISVSQPTKPPTKPPPPPLAGPRPKHGIRDFDMVDLHAPNADPQQRQKLEEWVAWRRAVHNVEADWH